MTNTVLKTTIRTPETLDSDVQHPIGTGVGAAGGAAFGAGLGVVGGPIGMGVGAAVGAVIGAVTGEAVTESLDFTNDDDAYYRQHHATRPYVQANDSYESYRPAYQYGTESHGRFAGKPYQEVHGDLRQHWDKHPASASLGWDKAEPAIRDAYQRRTDLSGK